MPTKNTIRKLKQFLDYLVLQDEPVLTYTTSNMILTGHSDTCYSGKKNSCRCAGDHCFLSKNKHNQMIKVMTSIIAKEELVILYNNDCEAAYIRKILIEISHPQLHMPLQTN